MKWVSGIECGGSGHVRIRVQSGHDHYETDELPAWDSGPPSGTPPQADFQVEFNALRHVELDAYVDGIGHPCLCVAAQVGLEAQTPEGRILVPSQLMIHSLFTSSARLRSVLLSPTRGAACLHALRLDALSSSYVPSSMNRGVFARGRWITSSPSASASWGSVYRFAIDGRLDLSLPRGRATFSVAGPRIDGVILARRMSLLAIETDDLTGEVDSASPIRQLILSGNIDRALQDGSRNITEDERFRFKSFLPMSEAQWERAVDVLTPADAVPGIASTNFPNSALVRDLVDAIRFKLGKPCVWSATLGNASLARDLYRTLVRQRRWDQLARAIN